MGEETSDPQAIKKVAAAAYNYENDPRWADYWANVLIPPHMASRSDVVDHFKRKFYQRYVDPDYVVEPMTTSNSSQSTRASARSSSPLATEDARPRNTGSSTRASAQTGRNASSFPMDRRGIHFAVNAWVLVMAVLGALPLVPSNLAKKAYQLSLFGTAASSLYSLYTLYGKPSAWNLPAVQMWFQSIIATKDFIHFLFCLTFVTSQLHFKFALIPVLCWALEHVAKFLRRNFTRSALYRKYLEEPCLWVETNTSTLSILSSHAEIALGVLLIVALFSRQRNIIQTFMYWHMLKLMYHAPVTAGYHQSVWARIGRTINPYVSRYAPFLNTPLSAVQGWWLR